MDARRVHRPIEMVQVAPKYNILMEYCVAGTLKTKYTKLWNSRSSSLASRNGLAQK